jgi:predicted Holliday junction resolvase-like endonuclease
MHQQDILVFFEYQRQIFGICPCCGDFFRLSDTKIYKDERKSSDWLDKLGKDEQKLNLMEDKIDEDMEFYKEQSREKGRKLANKMIKKVDKVFVPQKLNPDDAKVIFHPVDFVVFNGMKAGSNGDALKSIILLDSEKKTTDQKRIQKSIIQSVEKENYEWLTIRVDNDGSITQE